MKTTTHSITTTREALAYMTGSALTRLGHRASITSRPIPEEELYDEYLELIEPWKPGDPEDPTVEYVISATCDREILVHAYVFSLMEVLDLEKPIEEQQGRAMDPAQVLKRLSIARSK